ncbi:hypothetical protein Glove_84g4 [Diversispora epigaea]|uniref:Protein kinase domain-containing protein n=1 Tax=Diversispora epigaea TaxID=1348612 RepID=A0A397J9V8_9GLOM|nr:hypothetical protein Glove_84g4 [Diversispora epigaea]
MSQEIGKINYCPAGHSYNDYFSGFSNIVNPNGTCEICTKERFIQEFKTWSSGNTNIDKIVLESQINSVYDKLQWIPYNNFQNIEHIADGGHGSVYSAKLENGIKRDWNFIKQDWEYKLIGHKVALKEIKDSRIVIVEFLKAITTADECGTKYYGISKNPSTQNYIFVMDLFDGCLHNFLTKAFWDLDWVTKIMILGSIAECLEETHEKNLIHCDLRSGNILMEYKFNFRYCDFNSYFGFDLSSCKLENDLILNSNNKNNIICGSIPYIPPEVLIGNEFTREGDIYSFGGIMYEIITAQRPFADQAHDTYLMIDICNGVRPKVPDFMLNWIPEWYLDLMYRCWSDDPSERPASNELSYLFREISNKLFNFIVDNNVMQQLKIALENQENTSKSQKQELFKLFSYSSKLHPQSCYISRYIYTLHGLNDSLEEIKAGKSSAHDTYLMIDICNGVRPKVPDFMLNWIPEWYLDLMYRCWSDDPSERPASNELSYLFREISNKLFNFIVDNNVMQQLKIALENQENTSKSQKQELFKLFSYSSKLHPQSCYISRYIYTLHGLNDSLEEIKAGKSSDPNIPKSNESTTLNVNTYDISLKFINEE